MQAGTSHCFITKGICAKASSYFKKVTTCRAPCVSNTYTKESKPKCLARVLTSAESIALLEEKAHKKQEEKEEMKGRKRRGT